MPKGGKRPGAGRPRLLSFREEMRIGGICEERRQKMMKRYFGNRRALMQTVAAENGLTVSRVAQAWTFYRKHAPRARQSA